MGKDTDAIGDSVSWGLACRLTGQLLTDQSSRLGAAVAGWAYPVDQHTLVTMDMFDSQLMLAWLRNGKKGKKPKPYPRPWPETVSKTTQPNADVTQDQIVAALRFAGHTAEVPAA